MSNQNDESKLLMKKLIPTFGLILMAASLFFPWLSATTALFGANLSATGFDLSSEVSSLSILFLLIGSIMIWIRNNPKQSGIVCMLMGGLMAFETYHVHTQLQNRAASNSTGLVLIQISSGFYLLALGAILTFVGGLLLATIITKQENVQITTEIEEQNDVEIS